MASPFPGMDPYIEVCGLWEDFHHDLISDIKASLARSVPRHYLILTGERAYIVMAEEDGKKDHPFQPDVDITSRQPPARNAAEQAETAVAEPATVDEPLTLRALIATPYRETFIEI